MKIVLNPVAMVSAVSLVVALTLVKRAMNSFKSPPAAWNTPPVRLTALMISSDSTAKDLDTALIAESWPSSASTPLPNCLKIAMAPSAVVAILPNVEASSVLVSALIAVVTSPADKPA